MSLEELKWRKQKLQEQASEIDNSSILNERLDLYEFVDQKRKSKRQRRKKAQKRHEQQPEVDHIRNSDIYCPLQRDEALFKWLDIQRDARCSGYIKALNGADLQKACQFYRMKEARRRGVLQAIPMPVVYAEAPLFQS